jgi:hypothetical protein
MRHLKVLLLSANTYGRTSLAVLLAEELDSCVMQQRDSLLHFSLAISH